MYLGWAKNVIFCLEKKREKNTGERGNLLLFLVGGGPKGRRQISFWKKGRRTKIIFLENIYPLHLGSEVRKLQRDMQKLFLKQKEKGGIIDLEVTFTIDP